MKIDSYSLAFATALVVVPALVGDRAAAQVFADALTVETAEDNDAFQRLYQVGGVLAPIGSHLWFVADTLHNGIGTGATYHTDTHQLTLGADDVVIHKNQVNGQIIGNQIGIFQQGSISYENQYTDDPIFALLFNSTVPESGWDAFIGTTDLKYGVGEVNVSPPSGLGNYRWDIDQDIVADANLVTVVPEPAAYGVVIALALAGAAVARRGWRRV